MYDILPITLLISLLVHLLIVSVNFNHLFKIETVAGANKVNLKHQVFEVGFIDKTQLKQNHLKTLIPESDNRAQLQENSPVSNKYGVGKLAPEHPQYEDVAQQDSANLIEKLDVESMLGTFLKPADVDTKAAPLKAVEIPIRLGESRLLASLSFRVYVDKFGDTQKVVSLDENAASQIFYDEIHTQLLQIKFIPAKKLGQEVDSYLDVIFEF